MDFKPGDKVMLVDIPDMYRGMSGVNYGMELTVLRYNNTNYSDYICRAEGMLKPFYLDDKHLDPAVAAEEAAAAPKYKVGQAFANKEKGDIEIIKVFYNGNVRTRCFVTGEECTYNPENLLNIYGYVLKPRCEIINPPPGYVFGKGGDHPYTRAWMRTEPEKKYCTCVDVMCAMKSAEFHDPSCAIYKEPENLYAIRQPEPEPDYKTAGDILPEEEDEWDVFLPKGLDVDTVRLLKDFGKMKFNSP